MFPAALHGLRAKLIRAQDHLEALRLMLRKFESTRCHVRFEDEPDGENCWLVLDLPKPAPELSAVIGDCLFNLRSALDHLLWQLVLVNPPNVPSSKNMFPICSTPEAFTIETRKGRLAGLSIEALAAIESLQPYHGGENPLTLLNYLHNVDKHRALNTVVSIAEDLDLMWTRNGVLFTETKIFNDEVEDGATLIGIPKAMFPNRSEVEVYGKGSLFVAFAEPPADAGGDLQDRRVEQVLEGMMQFIRHTVLPAVETFFE